MHWRVPTAAIVLAAFLALSTAPRAIGQAQSGNPPTSAAPQQSPANASKRLYVAGNLTNRALIRIVPPLYPQIAQMARVSGTVLLNVVVAEDGSPTNITFVSGPLLLTRAAGDAVKQWRYQPMLLNGQPVKVATTVSVRFDIGELSTPKFEFKMHDPSTSQVTLKESIDAIGVANQKKWRAFMAAFESATSNEWIDAVLVSATKKKGKVTVEFVLRPDGSVGPVSVAKSSDDPDIDTASQLAITKAAPFQSVPADLLYPVAEFVVTFDYDRPVPFTHRGVAE